MAWSIVFQGVDRLLIGVGLTTLTIVASACTMRTRASSPIQTSAQFADEAWDDGMAVLLVFAGRVKRYGVWRDAEIRDYLVREYLDPMDLTKRDIQGPALIPVLKANRLVSFETGSYDYRYMSSFFFRRDTTALVKGVGSCQNGCGLVHQRWDVSSGRLEIDSYWESEGRATIQVAASDWRFADELPFLAHLLEDDSEVRTLPPLAAPRAAARRGQEDEVILTSFGIGDACEDCLPMTTGEVPVSKDMEFVVPSRVLRVKREGRRTMFLSADGTIELQFEHDAEGFLLSFTVRDEQEFHRVAQFRGAYWERTDQADRRKLQAR